MTESTLAVLYEDPHCLAVAKPAGLLTQGREAGAPTLEAAVRRHLDPVAPADVYLGTVHRLDRPVSGVVLWAKTPKAARRLSAQFAAREACKEYWAIVEGSAPDAETAWDDWLSDLSERGTVQVVTPESPVAKHARTLVTPGRAVRLPSGCAWLRLEPETGRTHQLRAQAAARELPILGDVAYGSSRAFAQGIALHARTLTVRHPVTRQPLVMVAPLPESWQVEGIELPADFVP